jgi:release factor glutamine methyltransferase
MRLQPGNRNNACNNLQSAELKVEDILADARRHRGIALGELLFCAELILAHVLGKPRSWLYAHPDAAVPAEAAARWRELWARLLAGEPLEYLLGQAHFCGLTVFVSPAVLVPRNETELLAEAAFQEIAPLDRPLVADVGTGSGAIALYLAARHPGANVVATDVSPAALAVAARNLRAYGTSQRVHLLCCHLLSAVDGQFDLVVANLPYVPTPDLQGSAAAVARYEPWVALDGGPDGLALVRELLAQALPKLREKACLLLEIGEGQGEVLQEYSRQLCPRAEISFLRDYAGKERIFRMRL